jgi:hypothetical protein
MRLCCNVRQRKPLNVPQKSYLTVNPPKRCVFDGGGHLLSVKPLQHSGQHYTSRRHRQHRAKKAAAAVRSCAFPRVSLRDSRFSSVLRHADREKSDKLADRKSIGRM